MKKLIIVGSKAAQKLEAVKAAARAIGLDADVVGVSSESGVPEQPIGHETLLGAYNRARAAAKTVAEDAFFLGIENGIQIENHTYTDYACVVVLTGKDSDGVFVRSKAVEVPAELLHEALASKQSVTAGSLEAKRSGCDPADPHTVWSGGKTDRTTILTDAVRRALTLAIAAKELS